VSAASSASSELRATSCELHDQGARSKEARSRNFTPPGTLWVQEGAAWAGCGPIGPSPSPSPSPCSLPLVLVAGRWSTCADQRPAARSEIRGERGQGQRRGYYWPPLALRRTAQAIYGLTSIPHRLYTALSTKEPRTGGPPGGRGVRGPVFFWRKSLRTYLRALKPDCRPPGPIGIILATSPPGPWALGPQPPRGVAPKWLFGPVCVLARGACRGRRGGPVPGRVRLDV
jgi:hypothetical protein